MGSSSSISSSKPVYPRDAPPELAWRLAWFFLPLATLFVALIGVGIVSGEALPATLAARLQADAVHPVLYLPATSDRSFIFKLAGTLKRRPNILVLGQSRSNQWRSAMFGQSFYNAAQAVYSIDDEISFIQSLGDYSPNVLILPVDFYQFNSKWEANYLAASKIDLDLGNPTEWLNVALNMADLVRRDPWNAIKIQVDPLYGAAAIGLSAGRRGNGFRRDGSFQYGTEIQGDFSQGATVERALDRIQRGTAPFLHADHLEQSRLDRFDALVRLARDRGIAVIGVSMPYAPEVVEALDTSPMHGAWREFRGAPFHEWLSSLDVHYFDFTELSTFGGMPEEFVDAFHPSEPAYLRMLLSMLQDEGVASLFPGIDRAELVRRLATASSIEVYRNEF